MAPRFHSRDAGLFLARAHRATLHLLAHTPSVETYYFTNKKVYDSPSAPNQPAANKKYLIIDLREERRGRNFSPFSQLLLEKLKIQTKDIFLFLNQRGSTTYVACRDCGEVERCPTCQYPLTYHHQGQTLRCHYCHYQRTLSASCPKCRGTNIVMRGAGTQKLEAEVKKIINSEKIKVVRIDSDQPETADLDLPLPKIIIGTELAWSKINWKKLEWAAFIDADTSLFIPEYKISDELWQAIHDARYKLPPESKLIIQTAHPEHPVFQSLIKPEKFYEVELAQRQALGYPPFNFLLKIFCGFAAAATATNEAKKMRDLLVRLTKNNPDIKISPPLEMSPFYHKNRYWQTILIKINYRNYKQPTKLIVSLLPAPWKADPNPNTILSL